MILKNIEKGAPTVFVHIPKTAGTSFVNDFGRHFPSKFSFTWPNMDRFFNQWLYGKGRSAAFSWGHIRGRNIDQIDFPVNLITWIRNPLNRIVSQYKYDAFKGPQRSQFRSQFPNFKDFVLWPANNNFYRNWLCEGVDNVDDFIEYIDRMFKFVGLTENYGDDIQELRAAYGFEGTQQSRMNISNNFPLEIDDGTWELMIEKNRLDLAMWEYLSIAQNIEL